MRHGDGMLDSIPIRVTRHCAIGTENVLSRGALHKPLDLAFNLFGRSFGKDSVRIHTTHEGAPKEAGDLLDGEIPARHFGAAVDDVSRIITNGIVIRIGRNVITNMQDVEGATRVHFLHGDKVGGLNVFRKDRWICKPIGFRTLC